VSRRGNAIWVRPRQGNFVRNGGRVNERRKADAAHSATKTNRASIADGGGLDLSVAYVASVNGASLEGYSKLLTPAVKPLSVSLGMQALGTVLVLGILCQQIHYERHYS